MKPQETLQALLVEFADAHGLTLSQVERDTKAVLDSLFWRRASLLEQQSRVTKEIESWPEWKRAAAREALNNPSTRSTPRQPVDNGSSLWERGEL